MRRQGDSARRSKPARRVPRVNLEKLAERSSLDSEDELVGVVLTGDFSGAEYSALAVRECRVAAASLTASHLLRATFVDCVIVDSDLSGAILEDCRLERVEFRNCRLSGVQAQGSRFRDVAMFDCKSDGANFRMTAWDRAELRDSNLADSDFYGARLPGSRIHGCDLSNVELVKCDLDASHLQRSRLDGLRGGEALRGATIGSGQIIPAALALFAAVGISVDDEE